MENKILTDPLHGKTLEAILEYLVEDYGWEKLGAYIKIKCFTIHPSISSSLVFLRKTPWARLKVENLYIVTVQKAAAKAARLLPPEELHL